MRQSLVTGCSSACYILLSCFVHCPNEYTSSKVKFKHVGWINRHFGSPLYWFIWFIQFISLYLVNLTVNCYVYIALLLEFFQSIHNIFGIGLISRLLTRVTRQTYRSKMEAKRFVDLWESIHSQRDAWQKTFQHFTHLVKPIFESHP